MAIKFSFWVSKQKDVQKQKNQVIDLEEKDLEFQNGLIVTISIYSLLIINRKGFTAGTMKNYSILIITE